MAGRHNSRSHRQRESTCSVLEANAEVLRKLAGLVENGDEQAFIQAAAIVARKSHTGTRAEIAMMLLALAEVSFAAHELKTDDADAA